MICPNCRCTRETDLLPCICRYDRMTREYRKNKLI